MALPADLISKVRQDFSDDDGLPLLQALSQLQKEDSELFSDRLLRCLVVYLGGDVTKLSEAVKLARVDWRDLIVSAEYEWGKVVRLLSLPFGTHPKIEIFKEWLIGKQIPVPWCAGDEEIWTIIDSEIRDLCLRSVRQLKAIRPNVLDPDLYVAVLTFLCIQGSREISGTKAIEAKVVITYRLNPATGGFEFARFDCRSQDVAKRGKWPLGN